MPPSRGYSTTTGRGRGSRASGSGRGRGRGSGKSSSHSFNIPSVTATHLVIVESPSKCPKISEYLGAQYQCIASKGHIRELTTLTNAYSPTKPNFQPHYTLCPDKLEHIEKMQQIISHYPPSHIILATDDDREGEAIAWHICQVFGLPVETTHRIVFHSITYEAILEAIQHPRTIDMMLVHAQQTRQILDVIVGFKISPFLWRHVGNPSKSQSLSAGRCQTPALRLVYDAHQIAKEHNPHEQGKYKIRAYFFAPNLEFSTDTTFSTSEQTQRFLESSLPENTHHLLSVSKPKEYQQAPPVPFHTSHLLQVASSKLGLTPKITMSLCQQLYQEGHITYMRTDSKTYSPEFQLQVQDFNAQHYGNSYVTSNLSTTPPPSPPKTKTASKKGEVPAAQEAHEAIRPTHIETMGRLSFSKSEEEDDDFESPEDGPRGSGISSSSVRGKKEALYQLIWRNTIESCMPACTGQRTVIQIQGPTLEPDSGPAVAPKTQTKKKNEEGAVEKILYSHAIEVPRFPGWKRVAQWSDAEFRQIREKQEGLVAYVSHLHPNTPVIPNRIEAEYTEPRPPFYYTEASLIEKLESMGIGRPSTFAMLVETIQDRGYVKKQDIEGRTLVCKDYICIPPTSLHPVSASPIQIVEKTRKFGAQKSKLLIQPLGVSVLEFLLPVFSSMFDYQYTSQMESQLDSIAKGEMAVGLLEKECYQQIKTLSQPLLQKEKETYSLAGNQEYRVAFGKSGPVVFRFVPGTPKTGTPEDRLEKEEGGGEEEEGEVEDGSVSIQEKKEIEENLENLPKKRGRKPKVKETPTNLKPKSVAEKPEKLTKEYLPMKKHLILDKEKLARGEYTLEELVEWSEPVLGVHEGESMVLKTGKFGAYVEWGEKRESIAPLIEKRKKQGLDTNELALSDVVAFLREKESNGGVVVDGKKILRVFTPEISVRMGRFGPYVYYNDSTAPKNTKPQFLSLKKLDVGYMVCSKTHFLNWLSETHGIGLKS